MNRGAERYINNIIIYFSYRETERERGGKHKQRYNHILKRTETEAERERGRGREI